MSAGPAHLRHLGRRAYGPVFAAQRFFTDRRGAETPDELWLVEHEPVFTQGQAGSPEHLLDTGDIPVVQSDRGGQVTYHGPGQVVLYLLADLRRLGLGVRGAVTALEQTVVSVLGEAGVSAAADPSAPGVYVDGAKIAALGLRVRRGCSYHGLSFNADLDLAPFARINPCGYAGQAVTTAAALGLSGGVAHWGEKLVGELTARLAYDGVFSQAHWPPALAVPDTDPS